MEMRSVASDPSFKEWINEKDPIDNLGSLDPVEEMDNALNGFGPSMSTSTRVSPRRGHAQWNKEKKPLTMLPLAAIVFFGVSGGPFGIEVSLAFTLMNLW